MKVVLDILAIFLGLSVNNTSCASSLGGGVVGAGTEAFIHPVPIPVSEFTVRVSHTSYLYDQCML